MTMFILGLFTGLFLGFCGASLVFREYNLRSISYFKRGKYCHEQALKETDKTIKMNDDYWKMFVERLGKKCS